MAALALVKHFLCDLGKVTVLLSGRGPLGPGNTGARVWGKIVASSRAESEAPELGCQAGQFRCVLKERLALGGRGRSPDPGQMAVSRMQPTQLVFPPQARIPRLPALGPQPQRPSAARDSRQRQVAVPFGLPLGPHPKLRSPDEPGSHRVCALGMDPRPSRQHIL